MWKFYTEGRVNKEKGVSKQEIEKVTLEIKMVLLESKNPNEYSWYMKSKVGQRKSRVKWKRKICHSSET